MTDKEERRTKNSARCAENKLVEFRKAIKVDYVDRQGRDATRVDLLFSEQIDLKLFDPSKSQRDRIAQNTMLSYLSEALGLDFNDIPPCRGGWYEFIDELLNMLNRKKFTMLYAKITVNEAGWLTWGEDRCFSREPDMEFTDADIHFLEGEQFNYKHDDKEYDDYVEIHAHKAPTKKKTKPKEVSLDLENEEDILDLETDEPVKRKVIPLPKDKKEQAKALQDTSVFDEYNEKAAKKATKKAPEVPTDDLDDLFAQEPGLVKAARKAPKKAQKKEVVFEPEGRDELETLEPIKLGQDPIRKKRGHPKKEDWLPKTEFTPIDLKDVPYA